MGIRVALNHNTEYHYDKPTTLGAHVVRLKPAAHCRTLIESYTLKITPDTHYINWQQDPFGNYLARLVFPEPTKVLKIEVELIADLTVINPFDFFVEEYAETFPFKYSKTTKAELQPYLEHNKKNKPLTQWLSKNRPPDNLPIIDWLVALNQALERDIDYKVRMEPGVQSSADTLNLCSGSCRDSGWLLVELLRNCGLAARFVSGYLVQLTADEKSLDGPSGPDNDFTDLHAWAEVYLPGAGWVGMDPTSGLFAGEGHIPLACTPQPVSAAAISGGASEQASEFKFSNTVTRIDEKVRVTKPYTETDWDKLLRLGAQVDEKLKKQDVRLTMGGEPTFVSIDDMKSAQWNTAALGKEKLELANQLMVKMRDHFAPGGLPLFAQGKWYPGEPTPRWALTCYWRTDGTAMWNDNNRITLPGNGKKFTRDQANEFATALTKSLGIQPQCLHDCFEDPLYHLQLESLLPVDTGLAELDLKDSRSRRNLTNRLAKGLDEPVGWMLPLRRTVDGWRSSVWPLRREHVFLMPGDSPIGLRLPLESITADDDEALLAYPEDGFENKPPLPTKAYTAKTAATPSTPLPHPIRSSLCVEWRDDEIYVFLPPLRSAVAFIELINIIETTANDTDISIIIEGYEPPRDSRLKSFRITPDPGVIEVNVHPVESFSELVEQTESIYDLAKSVRLGAEKFMIDGRHTGTGGGNHITFGGPTPEDSPFLRRPDLLASIITFWQHHPSLSYLFSGLFVGPTSQAPRVDEARSDTLYELEMALSRIPTGQVPQPWLVDRLLRHLLIDVTGNTHRAEICIDKLYSPDGPAGRQGLVEFRAFEMPPHARMGIAQGLLLRSLISRFWDNPYRAPLIRWGTQLHDRFMLPHYLHKDITAVIDDLRSHDIDFGQHWLDAFWEFRLPVYGTRTVGNITLELRSAIEPWHVLGEEASGGGMSRFVDSSMERLQLKVTGLTDSRYQISCNQRLLTLTPTGVPGEHVVGVRFRAWQPPSCLHPDLPVDVPLVFDVIDTVHQRSLGGCTYYAAHPGGRSHDDIPVNANVAETRRLARFDPDHHTPMPTPTTPFIADIGGSFKATDPGDRKPMDLMPINVDFPHTADLRFVRSFT